MSFFKMFFVTCVLSAFAIGGYKCHVSSRINNLCDIGDKAFVEANYDDAGKKYAEATGIRNNFYALYSLALSNMAQGVGYEYIRYESGFGRFWYGEKRITRAWWKPRHKEVALEQLTEAYQLTNNRRWKARIQESIDTLNQEPEGGDTHIKYFLNGGSRSFPLVRK